MRNLLLYSVFALGMLTGCASLPTSDIDDNSGIKYNEGVKLYYIDSSRPDGTDIPEFADPDLSNLVSKRCPAMGASISGASSFVTLASTTLVKYVTRKWDEYTAAKRKAFVHEYGAEVHLRKPQGGGVYYLDDTSDCIVLTRSSGDVESTLESFFLLNASSTSLKADPTNEDSDYLLELKPLAFRINRAGAKTKADSAIKISFGIKLAELNISNSDDLIKFRDVAVATYNVPNVALGQLYFVESGPKVSAKKVSEKFDISVPTMITIKGDVTYLRPNRDKRSSKLIVSIIEQGDTGNARDLTKEEIYFRDGLIEILRKALVE